jgi:hypothetical protein
MKKIVIYQENSKPIILQDDDITNISWYTKEVSKILELSKICILETSSGNIILKPSKVNSIFVTEMEKSETGVKIINKSVINNQDVLKD